MWTGLISQGEDPGSVRHFAEKFSTLSPMLTDPRAEIGSGLYRQADIGLPFSRSYLIAPDGTVARVFTGYNWAIVRDAIHDLIKESF